MTTNELTPREDRSAAGLEDTGSMAWDDVPETWQRAYAYWLTLQPATAILSAEGNWHRWLGDEVEVGSEIDDAKR